MYLRKIQVALIIAFALCRSSASEGGLITVDFETQSLVGSSGTGLTLSDSGFEFVASNSAGIGNPASFGPPGPDNGSNRYFYSWSEQTVLSITKSDGSTFSLVDFDGAEAWADSSYLWADTIEVTGILNGGGTVSTSFTLDAIQDGPGGAADFQRFVLPSTFTNLVEVQFSGTGSIYEAFSLDNITFENHVAAPVPEPSSLALLGIGAIGMCGQSRWRKLNKRQG